METQRNELISLAAERGWSASQTDNYEASDWSAETWVLESVWSPIGVKAYVTFPIDPQMHRERKPWPIMVAANPPGSESSDTNFFETSLIQWKNEKRPFIDFLENLRKSTR